MQYRITDSNHNSKRGLNISRDLCPGQVSYCFVAMGPAGHANLPLIRGGRKVCAKESCARGVSNLKGKLPGCDNRAAKVCRIYETVDTLQHITYKSKTEAENINRGTDAHFPNLFSFICLSGKRNHF